MEFKMDNIFTPSTGVDMVFNMNSLAPYSRSSIIYDADYDSREIIIAQPLTPFTRQTEYKELHLTTIASDRKRRLRAGVACTHVKRIAQYQLANQSCVEAVKIKYELPIIEINIRSAFRLPLSEKYIIKGKILLDSQEFYSSKDFTIRDISLSGMGLLVPKKREGKQTLLADLAIDQEVLVGVILVNTNQSQPSGTLPIKATVTRINPDHSLTHMLVGLKIRPLNSDQESILNKFIHEAQIDELKRLSGRG